LFEKEENISLKEESGKEVEKKEKSYRDLPFLLW